MAVAGISPRDRAFPVRDEQDSRRVWSADPLFAKPTCALDGRNGSARPGVVEAAAGPNARAAPGLSQRPRMVTVAIAGSPSIQPPAFLGETSARAVNLPCACPVTDLVY